MRKRSKANIVNISSINALVPFPNNAPYNLAKSGVAVLSETLTMELVDSNISVTCVHPGGIKTNIVRNGRNMDELMSADFERAAISTPDAAARIIVRGMKKDRKRLFVGADAKLMALLKRIFPSGFVSFIGKQWHKRMEKLNRA